MFKRKSKIIAGNFMRNFWNDFSFTSAVIVAIVKMVKVAAVVSMTLQAKKKKIT